MTELDWREQDWLQRGLSADEYQEARRLPADLTRSLYPEIFLYGPQALQILLAIELFPNTTDIYFDSRQRFLLRQCANHVYGIFASSMNQQPFMIDYLSRFSKLSETCDAIDRMTFMGTLCCLVGEGVFEEQSVLEGFREHDSGMVTKALEAAQQERETLAGVSPGLL